MAKKHKVVLQGHEGGDPIITWSGGGDREVVLEAMTPEKCVEGWVGVVQEKSVTAETHSGPEMGRQLQRQGVKKHPEVEGCC